VNERHVAIVGGGFSGVSAAVNLVAAGACVTLIERPGRLARGAAYGTRHADHLLNVRASGMSAFPDRPSHFTQWLEEEQEGGPASFAARMTYGRYVSDLLDSARGERLMIVEGEAVDIEGATVRLADGRAIAADAVVLAVGNLAPDRPSVFAGLSDGVYVADPWAGDIAGGLDPDDLVLLIGTGLTAIDAALILDAEGFRGRILALSRRGMVPRAHGDPAPVPLLDVPPVPHCGSLLRQARAGADAMDWRLAVDRLRPVTQSLWAAASIAERRRFLRHLRPYWDVHRHRIAPEIAARIAGMERLEFRAGRVISAEPAGEGANIGWRPRGGAAARIVARRIVNCTGPQSNILAAGEPLLDALVARGRIRPDPCRIGIDVDDADRTIGADGQPSDWLYAIGPMTKGAWWEIVAVPDIRTQTARLAKRLSP